MLPGEIDKSPSTLKVPKMLALPVVVILLKVPELFTTKAPFNVVRPPTVTLSLKIATSF